MVLMAGMLPGVERARRRRRLQPAGSSAEAPACASTRRPSFCLYAGNGHDHAHLGGSAGFPKHRSRACEETAHAWATLDSNAREAKERLDQKLMSQRESVVKRHYSTGSLRLPASTTIDVGDHSATATAGNVLQREVYSKKRGGGGSGRRFSWGRRLKAPAELPQQAECAVCLEEFRAGDVLACLPCAHRFHWACAVPWVQAASRCPFCRAAVYLAATD